MSGADRPPRRGLVPAEPAREHLRMLHDAGMSYAAIADVMGIPEDSVRQLRYKPNPYMRESTVARVLAIEVPPPAPLFRVGHEAPDAAREHVEQLLAGGMTRASIARAAGVSGEYLRQLCESREGHQRLRSISHERAAAILAVEPGATTAVERVGWQMVDATPVRAHLAALREAGWSYAEIARAAGVVSPTVQQILAGTKYARMHRERAERILAVPLPGTPPEPSSSPDTDAPTLPLARDRTLVTRLEAARMLGYSVSSLTTLMNRDPERWPAPVASRRQHRALLWDADQLREAAPPATATTRAHAASATVSDEDGLIPCLECGTDTARFRSLGAHLHHVHDMTAAEYRKRWRLPATAALTHDGMRDAMGERMTKLLAENPHALDHLDKSPDHLDQMRHAAVAANRETQSYPTNLAARRPGRQQAVKAMWQANADRLDAIARGNGFRNADDAVLRTRDLPARAAARATGLSAQAIQRRRSKLDARGE